MDFEDRRGVYAGRMIRASLGITYVLHTRNVGAGKRSRMHESLRRYTYLLMFVHHEMRRMHAGGRSKDNRIECGPGSEPAIVVGVGQ